MQTRRDILLVLQHTFPTHKIYTRFCLKPGQYIAGILEFLFIFKSLFRKHFGKSRDKESEALSGLLKELNNEQMTLQMHCLSLLWNFSETLHDRRLVLRKGGLQLVIKALLLDPTEYCVPLTTDEYYEVASINETAVGCLVQ